MEKKSGEAAADGPGRVRQKPPFGIPTQCPISQRARSHPPPILASWPLSPSTGGPAQPSHPRPAAPAQPSPLQGAPRLNPYPVLPCGTSPRVRGRRREEGSLCQSGLSLLHPKCNARETEGHKDTEIQILAASDRGWGEGQRDRMVQMQRQKQRETEKDRVTEEREVNREGKVQERL